MQVHEAAGAAKVAEEVKLARWRRASLRRALKEEAEQELGPRRRFKSLWKGPWWRSCTAWGLVC